MRPTSGKVLSVIAGQAVVSARHSTVTAFLRPPLTAAHLVIGGEVSLEWHQGKAYVTAVLARQGTAGLALPAPADVRAQSGVVRWSWPETDNQLDHFEVDGCHTLDISVAPYPLSIGKQYYHAPAISGSVRFRVRAVDVSGNLSPWSAWTAPMTAVVGSGVVNEGTTSITTIINTGVTDHGALSGLADNDHPQYVGIARQVLAGSGLSGGGYLSADVALAVGAGNGISVAADAVAVDATYGFSWSDKHTFSAGLNVAAGQSLEFGNDVALSRFGADELGFAAGDGFRVADFLLDSNGYRVTGAGAGFFRTLYAGELHTKSFVADMEQALAGSQIITKSVAPLAAAFTCPAAGATASVVVQAFQGFPSFKVFADGDFVRIRNFARSTGLTVTDCWGTVVWASTDTDAGTQTYTLTRSSGGGTAGTMTGGTVVGKGGLVLDYGVSGNGFIESVAQAGTLGSGTPYQEIRTWTTHPMTGQAIRTRIGNLKDTYGVTGDYFGIGLGDYAGGNFLKYEPNGGFLLKAGSGAVAIDGNGINIAGGEVTGWLSGNSVSWMQGNDRTAYLWNGKQTSIALNRTEMRTAPYHDGTNPYASEVILQSEAGYNKQARIYLESLQTTTRANIDIRANADETTTIGLGADKTTVYGGLNVGNPVTPPAAAEGRINAFTLNLTGAAAVERLNVNTTGAGAGAIRYSGHLEALRNSAYMTGYIFVPLTTPLTSTAWDGDAYSTTAKTLIDLSAVFGVPAGVKAVLVEGAIRDSGSAANDCMLCLSPNNTAGLGPTVDCHPVNNRWTRFSFPVNCDASGDIYYQITASGSATFYVYLDIWGYWI